MSKNKNNFSHIIRLLVVAVIVIISFLIVRTVLIPKTFWQFGHYRGASLEENADVDQSFAGSEVCAYCHAENHSKWKSAGHKNVMCENCHGALANHADDPSSLKPKKTDDRASCGVCHAKNISKPRYFPQKDLKTHNPGQKCVSCHNPHSPGF